MTKHYNENNYHENNAHNSENKAAHHKQNNATHNRQHAQHGGHGGHAHSGDHAHSGHGGNIGHTRSDDRTQHTDHTPHAHHGGHSSHAQHRHNDITDTEHAHTSDHTDNTQHAQHDKATKQNHTKDTHESLIKYISKCNTLESQIKELEEQNNTLKNELLREKASIENIKKRHKKELNDASDYAITKFAEKMTDIMENLLRAKSYLDKHSDEGHQIQDISEGVAITIKSLEIIFKQYHISRIWPQDQIFDYKLHEAVSYNKSANAEPNKILEVLQAGYTIKDRLIKPATVIVSKNES